MKKVIFLILTLSFLFSCSETEDKGDVFGPYWQADIDSLISYAKNEKLDLYQVLSVKSREFEGAKYLFSYPFTGNMLDASIWEKKVWTHNTVVAIDLMRLDKHDGEILWVVMPISADEKEIKKYDKNDYHITVYLPGREERRMLEVDAETILFYSRNNPFEYNRQKKLKSAELILAAIKSRYKK